MSFLFSKKSTIHCVGIGEILFDVFPDAMKLGGAPANFAFHCSQMGLSSMVVSAIGNDEYGEKIRTLLSVKFMPALLPIVPYNTGMVHVHIDQNGMPDYNFLDNTAYDHIPLTEDLLTVAGMTNIACFGSLAQRSEESRKTILAFLEAMPEGQRVRIFDVNLRKKYYSKEVIDSSLKHCEVVKCNSEELPILAQLAGVDPHSPQSYYEYLRQHFDIHCFIYTDGANESIIFLEDEFSSLPTQKADVVDTVGAGDSFGAAFLCALVRGKSLKDAHSYANTIAAFVCTNEGAMPVFPDAFKG